MEKAKSKRKKYVMKKVKVDSVLVNFRLPASQRAAIQKLADKYAGGNFSLYMRLAALNYTGAK